MAELARRSTVFLDSAGTLHYGEDRGLCGSEDVSKKAFDPTQDVKYLCTNCMTRSGTYFWPDGRLHTMDELE